MIIFNKMIIYVNLDSVKILKLDLNNMNNKHLKNIRKISNQNYYILNKLMKCLYQKQKCN